MTDSAISIVEVSKSFQKTLALSNFSLEIPSSKIVGLLGPNGAGKTTLIRIITQILGPDTGNVYLHGEKLAAKHIQAIGYMPEERGLYKKMRIGEQLTYLARLKGLSKSKSKEQIDYWLDRFDIQSWSSKIVEELSKGMQQKIQFIATVMHDPSILIFDEPFSGLDPINANRIKNEIFELAENGKTILFSTHRMEQVEEICEYITLVNNGQKILDGNFHDIVQQFKENKYNVKFEGDVPEPVFNISNFEEIIKEDDHSLSIKASNQITSNQVLQELLRAGLEIHGFKEVLPSLNEIFISQVESQKENSTNG